MTRKVGYTLVKQKEVSPLMQSNSAEVMLERMRGGVILCNFAPHTQSSEALFVNRGWTEITGYTRQQLAQEKNGNPQELILPADKAQADAEYAAQMKCGSEYELIYRIAHRSGGVRWVIDKGIVTVLPNGILQNLSTITEMTTLKEQEEQLRMLAQLDQLTVLNNKATFSIMAQDVLEQQGDRRNALIMLDIDNFKEINDHCGHAAGDRVLSSVGATLREHFLRRDILGRIGGDEFMILMTDLPDWAIATQKAEELCHAICEMNKSGEPRITVSLGLAFSAPGKSFHTLSDEADTALYRAKNNGKNQCQQYKEETI